MDQEVWEQVDWEVLTWGISRGQMFGRFSLCLKELSVWGGVRSRQVNRQSQHSWITRRIGVKTTGKGKPNPILRVRERFLEELRSELQLDNE